MEVSMKKETKIIVLFVLGFCIGGLTMLFLNKPNVSENKLDGIYYSDGQPYEYLIIYDDNYIYLKPDNLEDNMQGKLIKDPEDEDWYYMTEDLGMGYCFKATKHSKTGYYYFIDLRAGKAISNVIFFRRYLGDGEGIIER